MIRDTNMKVPSGSGAPVAGLLAAWMLLAVWVGSVVVPSISLAAGAEPKSDEQSAEELLKELDKAPTDPDFIREREARERLDRRERRHRSPARPYTPRGRRPTTSRSAMEPERAPSSAPVPPQLQRPSRRSRRAEPRPDHLPPPRELAQEAKDNRPDQNEETPLPEEIEPGVSDLPDVSDDELDAMARQIMESHGREPARTPGADQPTPSEAKEEPQTEEAERSARAKGDKPKASSGSGAGTFPKDPETGQPDLKAQQPGKPAWWRLPAEDRPYFFSWKNVPFEKACQDLEEMTGLSMIGLTTLEPRPSQKIDFQSVKIMSYDEALLTFNLLIQDMDCWVLKRDEYLEVRNLSEWSRYLRPDRIFNTVDAYRAAKVPPWDLVSVMYEPKQRSAAFLSQRATDSVPLMVAVGTVVPQTNQVELRGFSYYVDRQLEIIGKADGGSTDDGRELKVYELKHASPEDASRLLDELLPAPQPGGSATPQQHSSRRGRRSTPQPTPVAGGSTADQIEITKDTRLRRLLVKATPANHKLVAEYLEKYIDLPFEGGASELIKLEHADPTQLVELIRPMMSSQQVIQPPAPKGKPAPPPRVVTVGSTAILTPIDHMRAILIKAKQDEIAEVKRYIKELDVPQEEAKHQYVVLEHGNASSITSILTNVFSGRRSARGGSGQQPFRVVNAPANDKALILTGERKDIDDAKILIKELDVDPEAGSIEHLVHLDNASATTMGSILQSRFGGSIGGGRGYRGGSGALPKFIPNDESQMLIVVTTDRMWSAIERIIREIDESAKVVMTTKTYRLAYASAAALSNVLSRSLSQGQRRGRYSPTGAPLVQADTQSNVLLVTADDKMHEMAARLIAELDRPSPSDEAELRFIELATADVDYVVSKLQELFGQGGSSSRYRRRSGSALDVPVEIMAEPVSNRILITSSQEDYDQAVKLAKQIDADYAAQEFIRRTFMLEYSEPNQVVSVVQRMFASDSSGSRHGYRSGSSAPGSIKMSAVGRGLVVLAPKDKMVEIEELIKTLDTDPSSENEIRTYKVDNVDSRGTSEIARNLGQLFSMTTSRAGRYGARQSVKFIGNYGSDMLFVSAPSERMAEIDQTVQEMLKSQVSEDMTLVIKHYEIKEADPSDVAEMVEPILKSKFNELQQKSGSRRYSSSGGPQIVPHKTSRKVMVSVPKSLVPLAEELIAEFDQPAEVSTMRIIALKTARAEEIAPVIDQQIGEGGGMLSRPGYSPSRPSSRSRRTSYYGGVSRRSSSSSATDLTVTPVPSSNLIILKGPKEKVFEAEQLIAELDTQARPEGPMIKVYELKHADMYDVVNTLEEIVVSGGAALAMGARRGAAKPIPPVVIQPELYGKKLVVSAPYETIPIIDQIIELKESLAAPTEEAGAEGRGEIISRDSDGITKIYDVTGPSDDIASYLQKILEDLLGYWEAPYVKSFPFGNQLIVTGKAEHFKMVDEWLERLEKNPPPARLAMVVRRVKGGNAGRVVEMLKTYAPQDLQDKLNIEPIPRLGGHKDPMDRIKEIKWDDPIETESSQKGSPFVPSNMLNELEASLAKLSWAAAPKITVADKPTTQPAMVKPTTQPAAKAAVPAGVQKPVKKADPAPTKPAASVQKSSAKDSAEVSREDQARQAIQKAAFQAFTTRQTQIKYDEEAGLIYVVGPSSDLERLQELLDRITEQFEEDLAGEADSDIKVIPLQHLDVTIAAAILEQMFNEPAAPPTAAKKKKAKKPKSEKEERPEPGEEDGGAGRRRREEDEEVQKQQQAKKGFGGQRIRVFPNPRDQTLVIRAAKEDFPMLVELILKIDRPGGGTVDIQIFQLEHLNAYEVEQAIKATLKIKDGRGRSIRRRSSVPGAAGAAQAEALIEEFEQQMLEMQAAAIGQKGEGKFKLNPAKDINITSDATTNTIIVNAPPDGIKLVSTLIEKLEAQQIPTQIETFTLEHGGAELVADELRKVFGSRGAPRGSRGGAKGVSPSRTGSITIAADARTNSIVVRALKPDMEKVKPIIDQLDMAPSLEQLVHVYPVEHGDATKMAKTLETIFVQDPQATGKRALRITADADTNTILVWGPELQQKIISARIQQLEQRVGAATTPREIVLTYASPSQVAMKLKALFTGKGRTSRSLANRIRIEGDDSSGALYVAAPEEVFAEIRNVAQMMDKTTTQDVKVYPLQHAFATEVVTQFQQMMMQLMRGLSGSGGGLSSVAVTADPRTNSLIVSGTAATFLAVDKVLKDLDVPEKGAAARTSAMYGLTKSKAATVAASIQQLFGRQRYPGGVAPPTAVAEPNANVVFVYGTTEQLAAIKAAVIDPLENYKPAEDTVIQNHQIPVKYAKVEEVANILKNFFQSRSANLRGSGYTAQAPADLAVTIIPDPSSRQLIVSCNDKNKALIDSLLVNLDQEGVAESSRQTRVFALQYAHPAYVATAITNAFAKRGRVSESEIVKVTPEYATMSLVVSASADNMKKVEDLITELDQDTGTKASTKLVQLENARASDVANALNQTLAQTKRRSLTGQLPATVVPNDATNTLLVTASEKQYEELQGLITKLDVEPAADADRTIKPYPLQYADMGSVAAAISRAFRGTGSKNVREMVEAAVEWGTYSVIVTATPENHEKVAAMIKELDQPGTGTQQTYTIDIVNAEPEDVGTTLTQIYNATKTRTRKGKPAAVFTVPRGSKKVMVTCGESEIEEIRALIAQLDTGEAAADRDVRVVPVRRLAPREMSTVLTEFMRKPGRSSQWDSSLLGGVKITYSDGAGAVILTGPTERLDELEQLVAKIDSAAPEEDEATAQKVAVFRLENGDSGYAAVAIARAFTKPGAIAEADRVTAVADRSTNSVVVTAVADKLADIEKLVHELDQESGAKMEQAIVRLENARSDELAKVLTTTWRARRRPAGQQSPSITADLNSNAVVISASKTDLEGIKDMIAKLDAPLDEDDVEELRVIPLEYIDADETREILTEYLRKPGARRGRGQADDLIGDIRIQASTSMDALIVSGSAAEIDRVQNLVRTMDTDKIVDASGVPQIIRVENAPAAQLAGTLTRMFTEPAQKLYGRKNPEKVPLIMADDTTNSIVVKARNLDFNVIKETVAKLDIESTGPTGMKVIQVDRGVDVRSLASEIERTINQGERLKAAKQVGYKPAQVAIGVDVHAPALLVAGSPEMFDTVQQLVDQLALMKPKGGYSAKVIPVRSIAPKDMKRMIQQLIDQQSGGKQGRRR